jgi:hypothetical protein
MLLRRPLLPDNVRARLGERRIITVGEAEGRLLEQPLDVLSTTAALCFEVDDAEQARAPVDALMRGVARRIQDVGEGAFLIRIDDAPLAANAPRQIDLSPATTWLTGGFPIMKNVRLAWDLTSGPSGTWCVIASHPGHLQEVVAALAAQPRGLPQVGRFDSVGSADGVRIARHLQSWSECPQFMAPPGEGELRPQDQVEVRAALQLVSQFCEGVERCRWRMSRPTPQEGRLTVRLKLSDTPSAER